MKRAFIVLLLVFALICAAAIQNTTNQPPLSPVKVLGFIPAEQMAFALPGAIFAAGAIICAMGTGAELWRSLLPLCGADWVPTQRFERLADAGLWCGWVALGTCLSAQIFIFPWLGTSPAGSAYTSGHYQLLLLIGFGTMLAARLFNTYLPKRSGLLTTLMSAAVGLACGQCWWNGLPIDFLTLAMLLPLGVILCSHRPEPAEASAPFMWLCIAALAFCLYATGFSQLIINYPTGPTALTPATLYLKLTANSLLLAALIALLIPPLRYNGPVLRIVGGMCIAAACIYNAEAIFAPLNAWCRGAFPTSLAVIIHAICLCILAALTLLRYVSANKK